MTGARLYFSLSALEHAICFHLGLLDHALCHDWQASVYGDLQGVGQVAWQHRGVVDVNEYRKPGIRRD